MFKFTFYMAGLCSSFRDKLCSAHILQVEQEETVFCVTFRCVSNSFKAILAFSDAVESGWDVRVSGVREATGS